MIVLELVIGSHQVTLCMYIPVLWLFLPSLDFSTQVDLISIDVTVCWVFWSPEEWSSVSLDFLQSTDCPRSKIRLWFERDDDPEYLPKPDRVLGSILVKSSGCQIVRRVETHSNLTGDLIMCGFAEVGSLSKEWLLDILEVRCSTLRSALKLISISHSNRLRRVLLIIEVVTVVG